MRPFITFIALLFFNTAFAGISGQDNQNVTDANGMRQGHWVVYNSTRHLAGYADNAKVEEGDYKDNMKQGVWISYYPSGAVKSKITFKDNRPEGYAITYFENGKVNEEGTWSNNRWVGPYKLYYENGNIQHEFVYNDNGKRDGDQKYYYPNGQVMIDGNWTGGKQTGTTTEYYDDGSKKAVEVFNNGNIDTTQTQNFVQKTLPVQQKIAVTDNATALAKADAPKTTTTVVKTDEKPNIAEKIFNGEGYWKLYNTNRQISKDGYFHGGRLMDGTIYQYSKDGILQEKLVYKNGVYQGDAPITDEDKK